MYSINKVIFLFRGEACFSEKGQSDSERMKHFDTIKSNFKFVIPN